MDDLRRIFGEMEKAEEILLKQRAGEVEAAVNSSTVFITLGTLVCLLILSAAGMIITRSLTSQIGAAVQHMQSSSSELQVASNQQTMGSREQSAAMKEITTTMNELLMTSKQISKSALRSTTGVGVPRMTDTPQTKPGVPATALMGSGRIVSATWCSGKAHARAPTMTTSTGLISEARTVKTSCMTPCASATVLDKLAKLRMKATQIF